MRRLAYTLLLVAAQASAQESRLGADFRGEGERLVRDCGKFDLGGIGGCAHLLFTDHPLHIAVGSLAPLNGFAFGPAFAYHWTPNESWRLSWNTDAVVSTNGSWRAGGYMTAILTRRPVIVPRTGGTPAPRRSRPARVGEAPVIHAYAQAESLKTIAFYGVGPGSSRTARTFFAMKETIVGANLVWPVPDLPGVALFAEANARIVDIRPAIGETSPSTGQVFNNFGAPGIASQPAFGQFGEGIRVAPSLAGGHVRLNYAFTLQQFVAGDSTYSFQRFTADLNHTFPIYRATRTLAARNGNGPDDCSTDPAVRDLDRCPPLVTRNREGSFGLRLLMTHSMVTGGHSVPFYFQPTLGGSDVNGNLMLPSYPDYRFRGPDLLLARGSFEHSIWGPLGFAAMVDVGQVALRGRDLGSSQFRHSYAAGLTLRAGGLPMVYLMYAWGGEGPHTIVNMNTSLLGGAARPSLY